MRDKWTQIFSLVKKTGDKVIVFNEKEADSMVVMSLAQYEQMLGRSERVKGLTEEEMLDRINHDIARWQSTQEEIEFSPGTLDKNDVQGEKSEEEERYYVEPIE